MKKSAGRFTGRTRWMNEADLTRAHQLENLVNYTLIDLYPSILTEKQLNDLKATRVSCAGSLIEMSDEIFFDDSPPNNNYEMIVEASALKPFQTGIYREFVAAAYPNYLLPAINFQKFIIDLGANKNDATYIFRAADFNNCKFLTFRDVMVLLAALEPSTNHGGMTAEVRCRYIFRFFDRDKDNLINYKELREMIIYMRRLKSMPLDAQSVDQEHRAIARSVNVTATNGMSLFEFLRAAGDLKIRGLSQVLRLPKNIKSLLQTAAQEEAKMIGQIKIETTVKPKPDMSGGKTDYEIAVHSIRVSRSGTMINLEDIWSVKDVVSETCMKQANITRESRSKSCDIHSQESLFNELLKSLRYLASVNKCKSGNRGNRKDNFTWGYVTPQQYAQRLTEVCRIVQAVFNAEPRLLDVRSPTYIMGDFHGNFGDLQYFERMFWPIGPGFCPCNLLFLGDYVDRGAFGLEVVTYLFCYKAMFPHKIYLVRGNHEIREIQKSFTFLSECIIKFGEKLGRDMWETINLAFDHMPIAAAVDGKLFCCHGGIPPPWVCPIASAINNIPVPLSEPDTQSVLAWELLWNDPVREKQMSPELDIEFRVNEGFALNTKRGTAHIFNADGLERFLKMNGYTHVVRAHEMAMTGYNILLKGKLITIFSSSRYTSQNNEAACILAENGKMRMMRLDPNE